MTAFSLVHSLMLIDGKTNDAIYSLQQLYVIKSFSKKIVQTGVLTIQTDVAIILRTEAFFYKRIRKPFERMLIFFKWICKPFKRLINRSEWLF